MKTKRRFISRIWTHPLLWILMLMPIALVGHWLALYWPSVDNLMNMSSAFSHDLGSLIVHHTYATSTKTGNSDQGTSRNFHIDLETGSVKSGSSEEAEMLARGSTLRGRVDSDRH